VKPLQPVVHLQLNAICEDAGEPSCTAPAGSPANLATSASMLIRSRILPRSAFARPVFLFEPSLGCREDTHPSVCSRPHPPHTYIHRGPQFSPDDGGLPMAAFALLAAQLPSINSYALQHDAVFIHAGCMVRPTPPVRANSAWRFRHSGASEDSGG